MSDLTPEQIAQLNQLTLEKLKMDERLRAVETHMAEGNVIRSQLKDTIQSLNDTIKRIDEHLYGKGGIEDRIKVLENAETVRAKNHDQIMKVFSPLIVTAITVIFAAIGTAIIGLLRWMKIINI